MGNEQAIGSTCSGHRVTAAHATPTGSGRPLVLFDGGCPMCRREIAHYRRNARSSALTWIDIAAPTSPLPIDGIDHDTAMARFHVRDAAGRWHTGADAFVEMWSHLARYRHLARVLRTTRLVAALDWVYTRFASWRLARRCSDDACHIPSRNEESP